MRRLCPTLILHGEDDAIIPVSEAHYLQKMLEDKKIPHEIKIYPGAGHGFDGEVWKDARSPYPDISAKISRSSQQ